MCHSYTTNMNKIQSYKNYSLNSRSHTIGMSIDSHSQKIYIATLDIQPFITNALHNLFLTVAFTGYYDGGL